jgi:hypothetical protein
MDDGRRVGRGLARGAKRLDEEIALDGRHEETKLGSDGCLKTQVGAIHGFPRQHGARSHETRAEEHQEKRNEGEEIAHSWRVWGSGVREDIPSMAGDGGQ